MALQGGVGRPVGWDVLKLLFVDADLHRSKIAKGEQYVKFFVAIATKFLQGRLLGYILDAMSQKAFLRVW